MVVVPFTVEAVPAVAAEVVIDPGGLAGVATQDDVAAPLLTNVVVPPGKPVSLKMLIVGPLIVTTAPVVFTVEFVGPVTVVEGVVVFDTTVPSMVVTTLVVMLLVTVVALAEDVLIWRVVVTVLRLTTWL